MKREMILNVDGEEITVTAVRDGETIRVERDGVAYPVRIVAESIVGMHAANSQPTGSAPAATPVATTSPVSNTAARRGGSRPAATNAPAGAVPAPMTGVIDQVLVAEGDTVTEGQNVVVLEAMKMYIDVAAPAGGTVSAISVKAGDSVKEGDPLLAIG
jgi:biotin carboxyl carrier protein